MTGTAILACVATKEKVGCLENDDLENEDLRPRKRKRRLRKQDLENDDQENDDQEEEDTTMRPLYSLSCLGDFSLELV